SLLDFNPNSFILPPTITNAPTTFVSLPSFKPKVSVHGTRINRGIIVLTKAGGVVRSADPGGDGEEERKVEEQVRGGVVDGERVGGVEVAKMGEMGVIDVKKTEVGEENVVARKSRAILRAEQHEKEKKQGVQSKQKDVCIAMV